MAAPGSYAGREQAYVKHTLLRHYFSALIHKIAWGFGTVVYVDGFSGPWQSAEEGFEDTSFGIALSEMRSAKATLKEKGRDVRMIALLVEKQAAAFRRLQTVPERYPDIEVHTYRGDFVSLVPRLMSEMPSDAFAFLFIDPKGWRIRTEALRPLLRWPKAEVLFNFMFDFINRAASMSDPAIVAAVDELLLSPDLRKKLLAAKDSQTRKAVLVDAFAQTMAHVGDYRFVAETPIFRPAVDRTLYSLIYATRRPEGMEVFRTAQRKALLAQEEVRGAVKLAKESGPQAEFFRASDMTRSQVEAFLREERQAAERTLLEIARSSESPKRWGEVWPALLAKHTLKHAEANALVAELRKRGLILFPEWPAKGKRVPEDAWTFSAIG